MKKIFILSFIVVVLILCTGLFFYVNKNKGDATKNANYLNVSGVVVPHHDIVAEKRASFFKDLALQIKQPETIILVSPNHYSTGVGNIQITSQEWNLAQGKISVNNNVIDFLVKNKIALNEPGSFKDEHGIYNILADIHTNFPNAKIVPIIFKSNWASLEQEKTQIENLEKGLMQTCQNCLMVSSVDFSHYQPALLSQLHDEKSIRDLENLDTNDILNNAEVDSPESLALLVMWAKDHNTLSFNLKDNTSSDIIFKNLDGEGTTHVFGFYQTGVKVEPEKSVSFIFGGDTIFTRGIDYKFGKDFSQAFSKLGDRVFWGADAKIINFEGAVTTESIKSIVNTGILNFKFAPSSVKALQYLHINAVSLANNHSDNAGSEGWATTKQILSKNNIQTFGYSNFSGINNVGEFEGRGIKLVVIGVNLTYPGQSAEPVVSIIKKYKQNANTKVVVMPHWGQEYFEKHTKTQQDTAHLWIDAGADLIIGSHPHVVEDTELYKNVPIFYSLGNFLFDQDFSKATQQGILVAGKFTEKGIEFFALPTQSISYYPELLTGQSKAQIVNSLYITFKDYVVSALAGQLVKIEK